MTDTFLSVHNDDIFALNQPSGLNAVRLVGVDWQAHEQRHLDYIRENISISKKSELKEIGL